MVAGSQSNRTRRKRNSDYCSIGRLLKGDRCSYKWGYRLFTAYNGPIFCFILSTLSVVEYHPPVDGWYSIFKDCIFCEVLFGLRIVTCNKYCFEFFTCFFSPKREKRRIFGEKFSQNPPLNGGVGGSGPLKPKKYLLIYTQKMGTKKPRNRCGIGVFRCDIYLGRTI